jgi:hypothetical protein
MVQGLWGPRQLQTEKRNVLKKIGSISGNAIAISWLFQLTAFSSVCRANSLRRRRIAQQKLQSKCLYSRRWPFFLPPFNVAPSLLPPPELDLGNSKEEKEMEKLLSTEKIQRAKVFFDVEGAWDSVAADWLEGSAAAAAAAAIKVLLLLQQKPFLRLDPNAFFASAFENCISIPFRTKTLSLLLPHIF